MFCNHLVELRILAPEFELRYDGRSQRAQGPGLRVAKFSRVPVEHCQRAERVAFGGQKRRARIKANSEIFGHKSSSAELGIIERVINYEQVGSQDSPRAESGFA